MIVSIRALHSNKLVSDLYNIGMILCPFIVPGIGFQPYVPSPGNLVFGTCIMTRQFAQCAPL